MLRITAALLFLSPVLASAQCLTDSALDGEITVEFGSGNVSHISRTENGTLLNAYSDNDSYYQETIFFESHAGIFETRRVLHEKGRWDALEKSTISYDQGVESIGSFAVGDSGGAMQSLSNDYRDTTSNFGWRAYESAPLVVGDCSYPAVRIFTTEFDARRGDINIREIKFLTDLGFGIQIGNSYYGLPTSDADIVSLTAH